MREIKKPNNKNYLFGAAVIFGGITITIILFILTLTGLNDNNYKFIAPSETDMSLEEGSYTIFYEHKSDFEGERYRTSDDDIQGLVVDIINTETQKKIEVKVPNGTSSYSINDREGYAIYTFELEKDSRISIKTVSQNNQKVVLNINGSIVGTILLSIFILLLGLILSIVVGLMIILVTVSKINKYNKEMLSRQFANEAKIAEHNKEEVNKQLEEHKVDAETKKIDEEIEHESVKKMWSKYLDINNLNVNELEYEAWAFGSNEGMARELVDLVLKGKKQGTASLHMLYEIDKEKLPKTGEYSIITDWDGKAKCIIETTDVTIKPFNIVDKIFAGTEGEGDGSLYFWKKVHSEFFTKELKTYGLEFTEDVLVVCESFKVVYK